MASKKKFSVVTSIGCTMGIILMLVIGVGSGAYNDFAAAFGLPQVSIAQLMPGADDMQKNGLGLNLQKPDTSAGQSPGSDGGAAATPGQDSDTQQGQSAMRDGSYPASAASPIGMQDALALAESMPTATPHPKGYDRDAQFGDWANSDQLCGYGTTRDLILQRDLTDVGMNERCQVTSGTFHDPYTGETIKFRRGAKTSSEIQIDHVVAANDAWASGLWRKDRASDRKRFYNDPEVLLASKGSANNEKSMGVNLYSSGVPSGVRWSDSTPSVWLPGNEGFRCDYMARRVYVKDKYDLTMSEWEKSETVGFLRQCVAG